MSAYPITFIHADIGKTKYLTNNPTYCLYFQWFIWYNFWDKYSIEWTLRSLYSDIERPQPEPTSFPTDGNSGSSSSFFVFDWISRITSEFQSIDCNFKLMISTPLIPVCNKRFIMALSRSDSVPVSNHWLILQISSSVSIWIFFRCSVRCGRKSNTFLQPMGSTSNPAFRTALTLLQQAAERIKCLH